MLPSLRDGSELTILRVATMGYRWWIQLAVSSTRNKLTTGQPVLALTLHRQRHGRVAARLSVFESRIGPDWGQQRSIHGSPALEVDTLALGQEGGHH